MVTGRAGAGKYTIAGALLEQYGDDFDVAWVICHEKSTPASIRKQILTQLFPDQTFNESESLQASLSHLQMNSACRWMIVINQAEQLSNQLLVELWGLVEASRKAGPELQHSSVLLFSEPAWANRISKEMNSITGQDQALLQIPPLTLDERKSLFVSLQSRLDGDELDVDLNERELNDQEGLPGEVVALLAGVQTPVNLTDTDEHKAPVKPLPILWIAAIAGLILMALILMWALSGDEDNSSAKTPSPEMQEQLSALEIVEPSRDSMRDEGELLEQVLSDAQEQAVEVLPERLPQDTMTTDVDDESNKARIEVDEETLARIEQAEAALAGEKTAVQEVPVIEPKPKSEPAQNEAPKTQASKSVAQPETAPVPMTKVWWQQAPASQYVLQMVVMSSPQSIDKFAARYGLGNDERFKVYTARRKGSLVYIGVYGEYASSDAARSALKSFASNVQQLKPWPRSIASIQKEAVILE
nr:AAA family ATPase [Echinimonas agarilytica]